MKFWRNISDFQKNLVTISKKYRNNLEFFLIFLMKFFHQMMRFRKVFWFFCLFTLSLQRIHCNFVRFHCKTANPFNLCDCFRLFSTFLCKFLYAILTFHRQVLSIIHKTSNKRSAVEVLCVIINYSKLRLFAIKTLCTHASAKIVHVNISLNKHRLINFWPVKNCFESMKTAEWWTERCNYNYCTIKFCKLFTREQNIER